MEQLKADLDAHIQRHKDFELQNKECMLEINAQQKINTEAINQLTASTQGLVDAWTAANMLSKFMKWIASFAIVAAGITWLTEKFSVLPFFDN